MRVICIALAADLSNNPRQSQVASFPSNGPLTTSFNIILSQNVYPSIAQLEERGTVTEKERYPKVTGSTPVRRIFCLRDSCDDSLRAELTDMARCFRSYFHFLSSFFSSIIYLVNIPND